MKKKGRILAFLLCFVFLFFVGCGMGEESFGDEDNPIGDPISTRMLDRVKALSKPATYNFKEAVGANASENYYNIFAHVIFEQLYSVYEGATTDYKSEIFDFTKEELNNGLTYGQFVGDEENKKYYLYDSLRYTITQVTSVLDSSESVTSQIVTVDLTKGWNWSVPTSIVGTAFDKMNAEKNNNLYTIQNDWLLEMAALDRADSLPSFSQYYTTRYYKTIEGDADYADFYLSPSYVEGSIFEGALVNYYQDALEYATYLFVLGFDYVDDQGNENAAEKDYFDFTIDLTKENPITVKFGGETLPITEALERVKLWYNQMGNIVGLTSKNREQLVRFILDKVIGNNSPDKFKVEMYNKSSSGAVTRDSDKDISFNRNYKAVVENIIDYACAQTRIGVVLDENGSQKKDEDGNDVYLGLDQEYMASTVTDYPGNNFFANYKGADGKAESDDNYIFQFIEAGEYQSLVFMPQQSDIKNQLPLTDIWLAFEYYDDDNDPDFEHDAWASDPTKVYDTENGITINVGFRFFDKTADGGTLITFKEMQMKIPYGRYTSFIDIDAGKNPDQYWLYISSGDVDGNNIKIDKKLIFDSVYGTFNNNIGDGALDATKFEGNSFPLSGVNRAREYYMTNPSSSYGTFGTLNPEMFMGEDGCDYMEVYFDIVKDKTRPNINYNFKVALTNLFYYDAENDIGPSN